MNNKLTVNRLALGNLKARKKQYAIMIIGIILAMVFSSSVILFAFSAMETNKENNKRNYGTQSGYVISQSLTDKDYKQAVADGYITDYSFMHKIGFAYPVTGEEHLGATVAWFEDKAWDMYYLKMLEGNYPAAEGEVAIEKTQLKYLGYDDAKIGDTIKVRLELQNGNGKFVDKEYKLVGITDDRKPHLSESYDMGNTRVVDKFVPGIYVAKGTLVDAGGKEELTAFYLTDYSKKYQVPGEAEPTDVYAAPSVYLQHLGNGDVEVRGTGYNEFAGRNPSLDALFSGGIYVSIVIFALVFASCVAIINAFNTNLKERKKQIGLFRAVGTTKRQIINIFGREAFIISLIATPISVAASYVIDKIILNIFSKDAIMSKSLWALLVAAVANVIIVMLASLVPLVIASKITPMQAIRNINVAKKVKKRKIKSKKQFNAPNHLAKRNTRFYKGSTVAVSIMLTVTILFSCVAFSFVSYTKNNLYSYNYDYIIDCGMRDSIYIGISELDKQSIESKPYVAKAYGEKEVKCEIEVDELDNFVRALNTERFIDSERHGYRSADNIEEAREWLLDEPDKNYYNTKKTLGIKKEMLSSRLYSYDNDVISKFLEKEVVEGKIDYDKLDSGEEVIFVIPKKVQSLQMIRRNIYGSSILCDENVGKGMPNYDELITGESDYKVGDELTFAVNNFHFDEKTDTDVDELAAMDTVKIGAIIRPNSVDYWNSAIVIGQCGIITSNEGMNKLVSGVKYAHLNFDVLNEIDDDTDAKIRDDLSKFSQKFGGWYLSRYEEESRQVKNNQQMLTGITALIIIGFVICISIINNSITAHIRENKRVIGTLRAVGADAGDLVKSYVRQMLSMFAYGTGIGYGLFLIIFPVTKIIEARHCDYKAELIFNPWVTVIMTVISFGVCAINIYTKIKKEMKNSIVDNIREL